MLFGSGGIVTAVVSLVFSFSGVHGEQKLERALVLLGGMVVFLLLARSHTVDRGLAGLIARALGRYTDLDVRDYVSLLDLSGDYEVMELAVEPEDWLAGRTLTELALRDEGVVVLGINRPDGSYVGAPTGSTLVGPGDTLVVYGRQTTLCELDRREAGAAGDRSHAEAVAEQERVEASQEADRREPVAELMPPAGAR
jgi:K+/H+ antiporter YhaU regulatory subunit KhtT